MYEQTLFIALTFIQKSQKIAVLGRDLAQQFLIVINTKESIKQTVLYEV
jgi:hypothetical protein